MDFMNIPVFDKDFYKLCLTFFLNIVFVTILIQWYYKKNLGKKEYLFTFYMISIIVFFLSFTLKKYTLDIGLALGLFAIFGIIRYRTEPVHVKEMTYLFIVIGVSIMNALINKKLSLAEVFFANTAIVSSVALIDRIYDIKFQVTKRVLYENIENIKPENYDKLKQDLEERTGITINRISIEDIDFVRDYATVMIHYYDRRD